MSFVMDANALIALLDDEQGAEQVDKIFRNPSNMVFVHAVNLCEVYYGYHRSGGISAANESLRLLNSLGIIIREDMDSEFWLQAGEYKSNLHRISLADCFCMTLANRLDAEMVTADHHEFDAVQEQKLCRIRFIR